MPSGGGGNQTAPSGAVNGTQPSGGGQNNTLGGLPTSASYGNSVYPGAATFLTPTASKSVSPLYRIDAKENVTFVWGFTDLLVRPSNLTLAAVGPNKVTYTITALAGGATSAVWQVKDVPSASPLMMGMYQIQLYDQRGISAPPQPGWLSPATRLSIAFYSPEAYQPATGCKCLHMQKIFVHSPFFFFGIADYCPTCFYNAGKRMAENYGPIIIACGVASATSAMILYGLLY